MNVTAPFRKSKDSDLWATPQKLFDELHEQFRFTMDPCCTDETAKCPLYFTPKEDGLAREWWFLGDTERAFVNPPYSNIKPWFAKAKAEIEAGRCELAVFLVPSRTGTDWWHEYAQHCEIRWLRGRIQFNDCGVNAPFDCCLVIMYADQLSSDEACDLSPASQAARALDDKLITNIESPSPSTTKTKGTGEESST